MKSIKKINSIGQILLLTLLCVSCATPETTPTYSIGSASTAGMYQSIARNIARFANENTTKKEFRYEDELSSGSVANISALIAGDIQFGIVQADDQYQAVNGIGKWESKGPQGDLRSIFSMYAESVTLVAGGDTEIRSIHDLAGRRVDIGLPGSGTRKNAIESLMAAGIDWENDIDAQENDIDERLTLFMKGEIDAFFFTVGHPSKEVKFATFSVRGARILSLTNVEGVIEGHPYCSEVAIPAQFYPRAVEPVTARTYGVRATLLTAANIPDNVVYELTKAVFENIEEIADLQPGFDELRDGIFLEGLSAPLHSGALEYYREVGITVPSPD